MILSILSLVFGLILLVWSADRFIDGAAVTARHFGMSPLLIGMVIVGFGTSAPEMVVSAISALEGDPGIALGNAYGSNISNIAFILGVTALISPIFVDSKILKKELPILTLVTVLSVFLIWDRGISRLDAFILLVVFFGFFGWSIRQGIKHRDDSWDSEMEKELGVQKMGIKLAVFWLILGSILLVVSSRMLVWGAVFIAQSLGVSNLIIGLTIVALGTSLPELASSVAAAIKGEHDIALGNVIGSNMFNTLAVVGIAGSIQPMAVEQAVLSRDMLVMGGLTLSLFIIGFGFNKKNGVINRFEEAFLLAVYLGYTGYLLYTVFLQRSLIGV
ncbi:MAG: calcium/sodium antiporter [Spirochaetia bacterium]